MARTRSMSRNYQWNHDASSSRTRPRSSCAPWSDLDHDLLCLVMMKLGFGDYYSFKGVCKSWRSFAHENQKKFMGSRPPMSIISICCRAHEKTCYLEDFEKRRFKTILPHSPPAVCTGLTSGFLIFFVKKTRSFWLVNPITRKQLHFPDFPIICDPVSVQRAILVFSASISEMVFVVLYYGKIWFSTEGKGAWSCVPHSLEISDLYAFKGKIYALGYIGDLYEVGLSPQPNMTLLRITESGWFRKPLEFVRSDEKLYVLRWLSKGLNSLYEVDFGEMKWALPCEKTLLGEYAFFHSEIKHGVVLVKRESWADPRSWSNADTDPIFTAKMWYFPHQYNMDVDCIDD